ncbi:MAG: DUF2088 domain-containing protein [Actinobacteria bacterium]|nr:DUF2088 domain-containing protein [Actinomycetota bacterium]
MIEEIVFGDRWVRAELPDDMVVVPPGVSIPLDPVEDIGAAVRAALDQPLDLPPLREVAKSRSRILIAFDDPTVPCYAPVWAEALREILKDLSAAGVREDNVWLLCANALHRQFTFDELRRLIGEEIADRFQDRLTCHDAEDSDGMVSMGQTAGGFHVDLNRRVEDSDLVIYLNCSTTRGFSGGWKSICVGLSSYRSIAHHHDPETMSMSLSRNLMHEILDEMGELVIATLGEDRFFKIETVLSNPLQVAKVFTGTVGATRRAALEVNRAHMTNRREMIEEKTDIVLYGVPDWSPYAAYSYTNPILTMISTGLGYLGGMIEALGKPGCTAILATPCPDRWDEERHPSYREVWERVLPETKDPFEAKQRFEEEFATRSEYVDKYRNGFGFHGSHGIMALYPLKRLRHSSRVIVAGAEDPHIVQHAGFTHCSTVEDAISEAKSEQGNGATTAFVRYPPAMSRQ